tara:strand:- start:517 stop:657 length:141 start_codon:yes stop_codon:yes gene_type:complete
MVDSFQKAFSVLIAQGLSFIAIELGTVSRQAAYSNLCIDSTVGWIN